MDRKIFFTQVGNVLRDDGHVVNGDILDNDDWVSLEEDDFKYSVKNLSIDLTSNSQLRYKKYSGNYQDNIGNCISSDMLLDIVRLAEKEGIESITLTGDDINLLHNVDEILFMIKQNFSGHVDIITDESI